MKQVGKNVCLGQKLWGLGSEEEGEEVSAVYLCHQCKAETLLAPPSLTVTVGGAVAITPLDGRRHSGVAALTLSRADKKENEG